MDRRSSIKNEKLSQPSKKEQHNKTKLKKIEENDKIKDYH